MFEKTNMKYRFINKRTKNGERVGNQTLCYRNTRRKQKISSNIPSKIIENTVCMNQEQNTIF